MKVLQINTVHKEKSTGRTCEEVNRALEASGNKGYVAYGRGKHKDTNAYRIGTEIEYYTHNLLARLTGLQGYFSYFATKRLIKYIKNLSPDIIHLRNLHAFYLNYPLFFKYLKDSEIPIILNLHDCWALTGKCAHNTDIQCDKWKKQCFNCPVVKSYPKSYFFDQTRKQYKDKKNWFDEIDNLSVIGVSEWVSNQARMSFLSEREITTVYNWIDTKTFYPRKSNVSKKIGIKEDKFVILGVSSNWTEGSPRYEDFIKLSKKIPESMQIVLVGQSNVEIFPENISRVDFMKNIDELAEIYSSADVYVHLSTEDTFGKVVAEAMACGTPAIVYNSTALPELIKDGCGYTVEKRNVQEVFDSILKIQKKGKEVFSGNCVNSIKENFSYSKNTIKLIENYNKLLT
ncbi:glycosyltransferase [Sporosarcina psychrophila]|uniref:glycosyltransferase n=1 Tax=Sporosarcina psychrophila TaxID=1476 RepID=UPI0030CD294D